jgi:hypothetical protein
MHAVRFGSVGFKKVIQTKPNQTNTVRIGSVVAVYYNISVTNNFKLKKKKLEIPI